MTTQLELNALQARLEAEAKGHDCSVCQRPLWVAWIDGTHQVRCLCLTPSGRPAPPTWRRQESYLARRRREVASQTGIVKWEPATMLARLKEAEDAKIFPTDRDFTPALRNAYAQVAALYHLDPLLGEIMPYQGRIYIPIAGRRRKDDEAGRRASFKFEPISKAELQAYIDTAGFSEGDTPARCIATTSDGRTVERVARVKVSEGMGRDGRPSPYLPTSAWRFEMACKRAERFCREILWGPITSPLARTDTMVVEGEVGIELEPAAAIAAPEGNAADPLYAAPASPTMPLQSPQDRTTAASAGPPMQGVTCAGHQAPMVMTKARKLGHLLEGGTVCYGMPAAAPGPTPAPEGETAENPMIFPPGEVTPSQ